ncbi:MAG: choice-of-anchor D domain-containing protein ['Candidatus Kapabacteria' thiocyanatum]|nr:choice-of-anchor D domain-containing protein ['Candidatus Kapabacteria' thiocyanatum]
MVRPVRIFSLLVCLVSLLATLPVSAQKKIPTTAEMLSVNGAQGKEFWIAIPPNEIQAYPTKYLEIYVASAYDTEIEVYSPGDGTRYRRTIQANGIRTLSDKNGSTNWGWEVRDPEVPVTKAIRITGTQPISVYVLSSKQFTSDGYLALPTSVWGTDYIATTYYDFSEIRNWGGGFIVISRENGTEIDIDLRGSGAGAGRTKGGRQINTGVPVRVTLDEGAVYMVQGDGLTRNTFDLSGSRVRSNKPIGMISFHERTTMPNSVTNVNGQLYDGRNCLMEMTPPVSTWGKKYVTIGYSRTSNGKGKGDFFRVFASQPNTQVKWEYFDNTSFAKLGGGGAVLAQASDFTDIYQASAPTVLPNGISVWTADKPIFVMQYSCSWLWDEYRILDPFMINVVPTEQFIPNTIFQTPTNPDFLDNLLNLVVQADTTDPNYPDLKTLEIDGIPVFEHPQAVAPLLLLSRLPGTDLFFARIRFKTEATAHRITSNGKVKFGGYIYGYGDADAYGWPAATGFRPTSILDTLPPQFTRTSVCGDYSYEVTELRNIPDPPRTPSHDSDQVETGISEIDFNPDPAAVSTNYRIVLETDTQFPRSPSYKRFRFRLEVIDKSKDAVAYLYFRDYADNLSYDTVYYYADKISITPNPVDMGRIRVGTSQQQNIVIKNTSSGPVTLTSAILKSATDFVITAGAITGAPVVLQAGEEHTLTVTYTANTETTKYDEPNADWDIDTVLVKTQCSEFKIGARGMGVQPVIAVEDFDAGVRSLDEEFCKSGGLEIKNLGTEPLVITGFSNVGSNFTTSTPLNPPLPHTIAPKSSQMFTNVCYKRGTVGSDNIDVIINSNAATGDSISNWIGRTQTPGPAIRGYDWRKRRVNTAHRYLARVWNSGNQTLTVTDVTFTDGSKYYPAGSNDGNFVFKVGRLVDVNGNPIPSMALTGDGSSTNDTAYAEIFFRPDAQTTFRADIKPVFTSTAPQDQATPDRLDGEGILPTIRTSGASMSCQESPEGQGIVQQIVITNNGTMPLTISRLAFAAGTNPAWQWVTPPTPGTPIFIAGNGGSQSFDVRFTRPVGGTGSYKVVVEIENDAVVGNGVDTGLVNVQLPVAMDSIMAGPCTGPDIAVTDIDFGDNLTGCDTPELEFTIANTGGGLRPLEIRAITPVGADAANFTITGIFAPNGQTVSTPFTIPAGAVYRVAVRFNPTEPNAAPWANRTYQFRYHIENYIEGETTELKPDVYSSIRGVGYVIPVNVDLSNDMTGTQTREPGKKVTFTVSASSSNWGAASLSSFVANVIYDTRALSFDPGSVQAVGGYSGWTVSGPVITAINATQSQMQFTLTGASPITANGSIFTFTSTLLLANEFTSKQDLTVELPRVCLIPTTSGDSTGIFNCALSRRVVDISKTQFAMANPTPNPSSSGQVTIDIGVGLTTATSIDLVNIQGQVVKTFVSTIIEKGEYTLQFPTTGLGNGVYYLRMHSGPFSATRQVVIAD